MGAVKKKLVSLGIGTAVMGGLALYAYFGTYQGKKAEEEKKQAEEKIGNFKLDDVKELSIEAKGTKVVVVAAGEGENKWKITEPRETLAEKATVEATINFYVDLKRKRAFPLDAKDKKSFGLEPPMSTVTFKLADGRTQAYHVGKKNSFDDQVYLLKDGDTQVSMVPVGAIYHSDRDLLALRDKRVVAFEDKDVRKIEVEIKGAPAYTIEKRGEEWQLTKPIDAKAEKAQVATILSSLRYLKAKAIAEEEKGEVDGYGFSKPEAVVSLYLGEAQAKTRVLFSTVRTKAGSETYFTYTEGQKPILELNETFTKKLDLKPADMRDKQVLTVARDDVKKVKLAETGKDFVIFEKKDNWEILAPEQKPAQDSKITNLVYKLATLKAKRVLTDAASDELKRKYGLDPVTKQATLYKADGSEAGTIVIGSDDGDVTAVWAQGSTRIDGVDRAQMSDLSFDVKDYLKTETASAQPPSK
jgi:Domain of unknown function (DUF4340)